LQERRVLVLNDVVEGVMPILSRLLGEEFELVATLDPELDPVLADPTELELALLNLAVNARDAMPEGGVLTIETANVELDDESVAQHGESKPGPHARLAMRDTGAGMDAQTQAHIFEPFFTTKPAGTGAGLGLATVHEIVKQSGGSIRVDSALGQGTTFTIYLPVAKPSAPVETADTSDGRVATGSETVLLVEDHESVRALTATLLERYGYAVIEATSAQEALRLAEANRGRIDLLLTDVVMPGLSGAAVAERVRELVPGVKVLFMSGYVDDGVVRTGALAQGSAFLEKPFSVTGLAAKVREALDAPDVTSAPRAQSTRPRQTRESP
jgi:two-component system, cell cycle sensor histidine kinase and response regulator CckA